MEKVRHHPVDAFELASDASTYVIGPQSGQHFDLVPFERR